MLSAATLCFAALCIAFASPSAHAGYVQVYSTIQKGALTFTGNTLELNGNAVANSGTPGTSATGGAFIAVDLPGTRYGTFPFGTTGPTAQYVNNSSRAVLTVPPGATVLYAELIWSGTIGTLTGAQLNSNVTFKTPSGGTYTITPSGATAGNSGTYYTRSANVTGLVQIGGAGTYTTGGVPGMTATSGTTDAAGWTLAVAYADPSQVARNLTIFVGAEQAGAAAASVSGFCTPVSGLVNGRLLVSGVEGDSSGAGDTMLFGPTTPLGAGNRLSGPNNLIGNFFASQINGNLGNLDTSGTFGSVNSPLGGGTAGARQGYDITNVDVTAQLTNSQTTAFAQGTTTGDNYAINALGLQINVTSPVFPVSVKTANKSSTFVGDTLHYAVNLDNTAGNGTANAVTFFDNLPAGMTLVANSVTINGTVQPGADPAAGVPIGNLPVGAVATVGFDVRVVSLPASPAPAKFDNAARWTYTYVACAGVVAQPGTVTTTVLSTPAARLEPVKSVSPTGALVGGQTATYTISIPNTGLLDTSGTTVADPIPAGTAYVPGSTKLNGVAVTDGSGATMPFASAALVNSAGKPPGVIAFGAAATLQFSVVAAGSGTVLNTATIDPDGAGPGTALTVSAVNSVLSGPGVTKAFVPATIGAGGKSTLTVTLTNPNAQAITGAAVTDNLPGGMVIANPANASTICAGASVAATPTGTTLALSGASIPASSSCTFTADVTVAAAGSYTNTIPAGAVSSANAGVSTAGSQSITVTAAPSVSKAFTPGTVAAGTSSTLTITLSNPTATPLTGVGFTDTFPATGDGAPGNMTLFDTVTSNTCGGTLTDGAGAALAIGSTGLKLVGASIAATNVCTITAHVKAPTGGAYGNTIPAGALTTSGGANTAAAVATLQIASPQVTKSFAVGSVAANTPTTMTITITNVTGAAITGLAFTDTYPAGLVNSAVPAVTNTCGGTATPSAAVTNPGTFTLAGATSLAAGSSCSLSVNVQAATPGSYTNTLGAGSVASSIGANAAAASATLNVARPNIVKAFSVPTIPLGGTATLTITLSNPTAVPMTAAAFTDTLPAGLAASAPLGTCVGVKSASGGTVSLAAGTIPANGSCTVTATVTGTSIGLKDNIINAGDLTVAGPASNGTAANASITVLATPTVNKSFLTSPILPVSGTSTLQIVLSNSNPTALTGATFTDTFPTTPGAMTLADLSVTNSCSGALLNDLGGALAVGSAGVRMTGGTIPSNGSCTITVNVKASAAGDYTNTIAAGALNTANGGSNGVAASAPLAVRLAAPVLTKAFGPTTIVANNPTTLTLTITNPSTTTAIAGVALADIFPAGMKVFATPGFTSTCGGAVSSGSAANDTSFSVTGATVPFNGSGTASCSVTMQVTSSVVAASPGVTNTTGSVTSTNANTGSSAQANLIVNAPPLTAPTIAKSFSPASVGSGGVSTITFTLGSGNAGVLNNGNFTDTLANMSVASAAIGGGCAGVTNSPALVVGATGANALNLTVPNVPPGGCTVTVQVTSTNLGVNPNSVSGVTTTQVPTAGAGAGPVNLTVLSRVAVLKAFAPASVGVGATSVLKVTLTNPNAVALTGVAFNDAYPGGLVNTGTPAGAIGGAGCSGTVAAAANGNSLALSGGIVPAGGSCDITANVTSATTGSYVNNTGAVTTDQAGAGASAAASLTVSASVQAPGVSKTFTPAVILTGDNSVLRVTLTNPNLLPITGVAFTDNYPATLSNTGSAAFDAISTAAGCAGTITGAAGSTALALASGNLPAGASCVIEVSVTSNSATPVLLTNPAFNVTAADAPGSTAAAANLQVLVRPTIAKSFTPDRVAIGEAATLTLVLTNPNPIPLTALAFTDTFPAGLQVAAPPNAANGCGGTFAPASGATSIALAGGSLAANQSCTISVAVSSATAGSYANTSGGVSSFETGAATAPSNTAVLTVGTTGVQVAGFVYSDANHNLQRDAAESGTGLTLYAKLVAAGAPAGPALQAVPVDPATGAYQFSGVAAGDYLIVIDDNALLADVAPTVPATWTGTETADLTRRNVGVATLDVAGLNFGLYNGNVASGRVFRDSGSGGGTPNNTLQDGTETGIGGAAVRLTNAAGTLTFDSTTTDAAGNYRLWVPVSASGTSLRVVESNPTGHRSVGGAPAGGYDRAADAHTFTYTAGSNPGGLNFADVAVETLTGNQQRAAAPGDAVFYAHTFTPGTGGSVAFNATGNPGWPQTVLRDTNCNGVVDAGEGVVAPTIATTAGVPVCVIVKVSVPAGAAVGAQNLGTLQAVFSYANASPPLAVTLTNDDLTTVGAGASLALVKSQDNAAPLPGGRITYTIAFTNLGASPLGGLRINDATPAYTRFVSAACGAPLAVGLTACSVSASPAVGVAGAVEWTLLGVLAPGAAGQVSFVVDVASGP